jgi:hypothetical protein
MNINILPQSSKFLDCDVFAPGLDYQERSTTAEYPPEVDRPYEPAIRVCVNGAPLGYQRARG